MKVPMGCAGRGIEGSAGLLRCVHVMVMGDEVVSGMRVK